MVLGVRGLRPRAPLVYYSRNDTIHFHHMEQKVIPQTKNVHVRFVDTDTAEILYDKYKKFAFGCCADGEKYLEKTIQSLINSVRSGRNVSLTCEIFPFINQFEADLFDPNIMDYPTGVY